MTEEMKRNDATRYFVVEFGNAITLLPTPYDNEGDARKAAEAAALAEPGVNYGVFQKIATARAALAVEWKGMAA